MRQSTLDKLTEILGNRELAKKTVQYILLDLLVPSHGMKRAACVASDVDPDKRCQDVLDTLNLHRVAAGIHVSEAMIRAYAREQGVPLGV